MLDMTEQEKKQLHVLLAIAAGACAGLALYKLALDFRRRSDLAPAGGPAYYGSRRGPLIEERLRDLHGSADDALFRAQLWSEDAMQQYGPRAEEAAVRAYEAARLHGGRALRAGSELSRKALRAAKQRASTAYHDPDNRQRLRARYGEARQAIGSAWKGARQEFDRGRRQGFLSPYSGTPSPYQTAALSAPAAARATVYQEPAASSLSTPSSSAKYDYSYSKNRRRKGKRARRNCGCSKM